MSSAAPRFPRHANGRFSPSCCEDNTNAVLLRTLLPAPSPSPAHDRHGAPQCVNSEVRAAEKNSVDVFRLGALNVCCTIGDGCELLCWRYLFAGLLVEEPGRFLARKFCTISVARVLLLILYAAKHSSATIYKPQPTSKEDQPA